MTFEIYFLFNLVLLQICACLRSLHILKVTMIELQDSHNKSIQACLSISIVHSFFAAELKGLLGVIYDLANGPHSRSKCVNTSQQLERTRSYQTNSIKTVQEPILQIDIQTTLFHLHDDRPIEKYRSLTCQWCNYGANIAGSEMLGRLQSCESPYHECSKVFQSKLVFFCDTIRFARKQLIVRPPKSNWKLTSDFEGDALRFAKFVCKIMSIFKGGTLQDSDTCFERFYLLNLPLHMYRESFHHNHDEIGKTCHQDD